MRLFYHAACEITYRARARRFRSIDSIDNGGSVVRLDVLDEVRTHPDETAYRPARRNAAERVDIR